MKFASHLHDIENALIWPNFRYVLIKSCSQVVREWKVESREARLGGHAGPVTLLVGAAIILMTRAFFRIDSADIL